MMTYFWNSLVIIAVMVILYATVRAEEFHRDASEAVGKVPEDATCADIADLMYNNTNRMMFNVTWPRCLMFAAGLTALLLVFHRCVDKKNTILNAVMLCFILFCAFCFFISYTWIHYLFAVHRRNVHYIEHLQEKQCLGSEKPKYKRSSTFNFF